LGEAAFKVFTSEITTAAEIRKQVGDILPIDEAFRKSFEIATVSKSQFARYYLRSLEMAAKSESTPWFIPNDDQQVINLEHVLPSAPEANWPPIEDNNILGKTAF